WDGLHRPADWRLAVRPPGGPLRPPQFLDAVGAADVFRVADDRGYSDLCRHRHRRADSARPGAHGSGPQPRRRIRNQRHLFERSRRPPAPRVLFELSIRDADWWPALRDRRPAAVAATVFD